MNALPPPDPLPHAGMPGFAWPTLPPPVSQTMLAVQFQLERSERLSASAIVANQFRQIRALAAHAVAHCPYYREHLLRTEISAPAAITPDTFLRWPVLRKSHLREAESQLLADAIPPEHGGVRWSATSGSTGMPVRIAGTDVNDLFRNALELRSLLWHRLDFRAKFAMIKPGVTNRTHADWGPAAHSVWATGPCATLDVCTDVGLQLDWLCREKPAYLLSYGADLHALARESLACKLRPEGLLAAFSYGDAPPHDLRALLQHAWNVPLIDAYSAGEFGSIALQCPEHPRHFHVQSESVYMEILRDDGSLCAPGESGRVVITDLHNFAMPLIRYEIGDYAEVGDTCPCGRGLPVVTRIFGRYRNMAIDPSGRRFYPAIRTERILDAAPIRQLQFVQRTPDRIEIRYVMERDLRDDERSALRAQLGEAFRYPFGLDTVRVTRIERTPGGKFEEFICMVSENDAQVA